MKTLLVADRRAFETEITRLNRRAAKVGFEPIKLVLVFNVAHGRDDRIGLFPDFRALSCLAHQLEGHGQGTRRLQKHTADLHFPGEGALNSDSKVLGFRDQLAIVGRGFFHQFFKLFRLFDGLPQRRFDRLAKLHNGRKLMQRDQLRP